MKELSCGFLLLDKKTHNILGCKPSGSERKDSVCFDIPKGHIEDGESYLQCALRELYEETGIAADEITNIQEIGRLTYRTGKKDLYLFSAECDIDVSKLHCESMFTDNFGNIKPEVCAYELIPVDKEKIRDKFFPNLQRIINNYYFSER